MGIGSMINTTKDLIKIIKARKSKDYKYLFKKSLELKKHIDEVIEEIKE